MYTSNQCPSDTPHAQHNTFCKARPLRIHAPLHPLAENGRRDAIRLILILAHKITLEQSLQRASDKNVIETTLLPNVLSVRDLQLSQSNEASSLWLIGAYP